jgi:hypothetical protein
MWLQIHEPQHTKFRKHYTMSCFNVDRTVLYIHSACLQSLLFVHVALFHGDRMALLYTVCISLVIQQPFVVYHQSARYWRHVTPLPLHSAPTEYPSNSIPLPVRLYLHILCRQGPAFHLWYQFRNFPWINKKEKDNVGITVLCLQFR